MISWQDLKFEVMLIKVHSLRGCVVYSENCVVSICCLNEFVCLFGSPLAFTEAAAIIDSPNRLFDI